MRPGKVGVPPTGSQDSPQQCARSYSQLRRRRERGAGTRKEARIGRNDTAQIACSAPSRPSRRAPRLHPSFCSRSPKAITQAAEAGRRQRAVLPCSGVLLQRPGEMRGKRQDWPRTGSGRCALDAGAQSEAEPVGGGLRRLPRAKKLLSGGVASLGVGGASSVLALRWSRVRCGALCSGSLLARLPTFLPSPLHRVPKPQDLASR